DTEVVGIGDPATADRAADGCGGAVCAAVSTRLRWAERGGDRAGLRDRGRTDVLQLSQGLDLRGIERDPAEHHREGDTRALIRQASAGEGTDGLRFHRRTAS